MNPYDRKRLWRAIGNVFRGRTVYLYNWLQHKGPPSLQYRKTWLENGNWYDEYGIKFWFIKWSQHGPRINESLNRLIPNGKLKTDGESLLTNDDQS